MSCFHIHDIIMVNENEKKNGAMVILRWYQFIRTFDTEFNGLNIFTYFENLHNYRNY